MSESDRKFQNDPPCLDIYAKDMRAWRVYASEQGWPMYRGDQIHRWLARGVMNAGEMSDLPAQLRQTLAQRFVFPDLKLLSRQVSQKDGTAKYLFQLHDGDRIESVLMRYRYGLSVCISSQAGCRMGCAFCASAKLGFGRNLTAGEMLGQVALVSCDAGERIGHVTIMGIGEPFDNYTSLITFLKLVNQPEGLNISLRHISVSTCGLIPEMLKFTDEGLPVALSVSLHAPNDGIRQQIMPIARRYPMVDLLAACRRHSERTGRRITIEYALLRDVNDRLEHAAELADRLRGMLCHVNLIPANEIPGGMYRKSMAESVKAFLGHLRRAGINATLRRELGSDILAACGQLRRAQETCATD